MHEIVETGQTSMTVEVNLFAEDLITGDRQHATKGSFVLVALDSHRKPTKVPNLRQGIPETSLVQIRSDIEQGAEGGSILFI